MKPRSILLGLLLVCGLAIAKTWGPFFVASLGAAYASTSFGQDQVAEFEVAQKIAQVYLAPVLNTPATIAKAIRSDFVRVVYADGQIADFKIVTWPSSYPLEFRKQVASADDVDLPPEALVDDSRNGCYTPRYGSMMVTYNTGYWGSSAEVTGTNEITITGGWVDTGQVSYSVPANPGHYICP